MFSFKDECLILGLMLLPRQLEILKRDVYRLKTDFDLLRITNMASSSSSSAWNATSFVSERLDVIESEVKAIAKEVKVNYQTLHCFNKCFMSGNWREIKP